MSAFKQSVRKLGVRAGLLAGTSAVVLAIAGIGAGSAMAAPTCPNSSAIHGKGSSLQKSAQLEVWTLKYATDCPSGPSVSYESTGSGPGLEAFRFTGTGTINHSFQFIGSDDAPNPSQIANAEGAAGGAKPVIVPVSQTSIAIVVHPPSGCKFKNGKGITWTELNKVFGGKGITTWSGLSNVEGTCGSAIKRVVRAEGSGTTFQFKNYLQTLHNQKSAEALPCPVTLPGGGTATEWEQLEEVGTGEQPNKSWPCTVAEGGTEVITAAGGGALAEMVQKTEGTIGYAALPDAKGKKASVALLQNGQTGTTPTYANPGTEESTAACENARYTVPTAAHEGAEAGIAVSWSTVFGAQPNIGGEEYPLCTLTYDVGWTNYTDAGYGAEATAFGNAVRDYVGGYIVDPAFGQTDLVGKWYSTMPEGAGATTDVQSAAEIAAANIG